MNSIRKIFIVTDSHVVQSRKVLVLVQTCLYSFCIEGAEADTFFCFAALMGEVSDSFNQTLDKSELGIGLYTEIINFNSINHAALLLSRRSLLCTIIKIL